MIDMKKVDWRQVGEIMKSKRFWLKEKLEALSTENSLIDWGFGDCDITSLSKNFKSRGLADHSFIYFSLWYKHKRDSRKLELNPSRNAILNEREILVFSEFIENLLNEDKTLRGRLVENRFGLYVYNLGPKNLPIKGDT